MEFLIMIVVLAASFGIGSALGVCTRRQYRPKWEAAGRVDAQMGFPRFYSGTKWIQKFYDTGYNSVEKEKANVYSNH